MRTIPKKFRNNGESLGLEYPYICAPLWVIWDRHSGKIVHIQEPYGSYSDAIRCRDKCRELNGLANEHDPMMNTLHDMEP